MYGKICYVSGPLRAVDGEYGPFTPSILQRHRRIAEHWAKILWKAGWAVICPHLNTRDMDGIGVPSEAFIKGDQAMICRLAPEQDMVFMVQGWEDSEGSIIEHDSAIEHGLIMVYAEALGCNDDLVYEYARRLYDDPADAKAYLESVSEAVG